MISLQTLQEKGFAPSISHENMVYYFGTRILTTM